MVTTRPCAILSAKYRSSRWVIQHQRPHKHQRYYRRWSSTSAALFQAAQQAVLFSMLAQDMERPAPPVVRATVGIAMATRLALTMLVAFATLAEVVDSVSTILTDPTLARMGQPTSQSIGSSKFQTASTTSRSCSQRATSLAAATAIVTSPRPLPSPTANSRLLGTATIRDFVIPSARWQSSRPAVACC